MANKRMSLFGIVFFNVIFLLYLQMGIWKNEKQLESIKSKLANENVEVKSRNFVDSDLSHKSLKKHLPVVIYNRLPKTGSTTFTRLIYDLSKSNAIYVSHLNTTKNNFRWSLSDQYTFVWNVTNWHDHKPAVYHGHVGYIPFSQFGASEPLYINIIREPLDRLVSYYYFLRYGDDLRKGLKRARQGDKTTFDSCVKRQGKDCDTKQLWVQIPFLCGQSAECWRLNSEWALQEAKKNILTRYTLVGVTEQMEDFIVVLESIVPSVFKGISAKYRQDESVAHVRKTLHKDPVSDETVQLIKASKTYQMERELYDFALSHFNQMKKIGTYVDKKGQLQPNSQSFRYEKVYGPNGRIVA